MPFTGMFNVASKADLGIEVLEGSLGLDGAITYRVNRLLLSSADVDHHYFTPLMS